MPALLIGSARCSTEQQDLTAQRDALAALGVAAVRVCVDNGLPGTNRDRPGLREALAACREGDTLVVAKLDRLARLLPDARAIADELTARQVWSPCSRLGRTAPRSLPTCSGWAVPGCIGRNSATWPLLKNDPSGLMHRRGTAAVHGVAAKWPAQGSACDAPFI